MMKNLIKNTEIRYIDYSNQLETLFKEKSLYQVEEFNSYRLLLKEWRNIEELLLKSLSEEQEYINGGMNPPYFYK
jgi:hypothetical protein